MITLPVIIGLRDWTDQVVLDLNVYGAIEKLEDESKWQEWAVVFCTMPGISQKNPPDPKGFTDWREWASRFAQVMT